MTAGCMLSKMASAGRNDGHVLPEHHLRGARCTAVRESGLGPLAGPPALSTQWTLAEYLDNTGITNTFPPRWVGEWSEASLFLWLTCYHIGGCSAVSACVYRIHFNTYFEKRIEKKGGNHWRLDVMIDE